MPTTSTGLVISPYASRTEDSNHSEIVQIEACLLLGSNIQPEHHLPKAVSLLDEHLFIQGVSSVWETPAVGAKGPNFLNAALLVHTSFNQQDLKMEILRPLEAHLGRRRSADKFAPRTIDIDVVTWDSQPIDEDLWRFAHTAVPVAELLPGLRSTSHTETLSLAAIRLFWANPIRQRQDVVL